MIFLFVFGPIICSEVRTYVDVWNAHRIRPQKKRPNYRPGISNELYMDGFVKRYGWVPDSDFLSNLEEAVSHIGK